jgi:hypothetical protein
VSRSCSCWLLIATLVALATSGRGADPPAKPPVEPAAPAKDDGLKPLVGPPVGDLKLPPGAVIVICNQLKTALDMVPGAVVLAPQRYQELMEQLEALKRQLGPRKPVTPTSCILKGQYTRDLVSFTAEFAFRTDRPNAVVALGCHPGAPTAVRLDEHLPVLLPPADDGYVIQVEAPGEHHVTLEFKLAVQARGAERRIELGLPRAAITTLEIDLPPAVRKVRFGSQPPRPRPADNRYNLGPADRLDLAWEEPLPGPAGPPLLEADAQVAVRVDEVFVTTEAKLTLRTRRGQVNQWHLLVPPQATVQHEGARDVEIDPPGPKGPRRTVRLKEPSAEDLHLIVQVRQPRAARRVPIGPFVVLDTVRQWGNITVSAPSDVRLVYHRHGDVSQRELTEDLRPDANTRAAFTYWNVPAPANPTQLPPAPLELEVEALQGAVEARVAHTIQLPEPGKLLSVATRLELTPVRARVDRVDVQLPAGYRYDSAAGPPAQLVERVEVDPGTNVARIFLAEGKDQAFELKVACHVPLRPGAQQAALDLPRLLQAFDRTGPTPRAIPLLDRGGQLVVHAPEELELTVHGPGLEAGVASGLTRRLPGEYAWSTERAPLHADLSWRPHPVDAVADVVLTGYRARIRHRVRIRFPDVPSTRVVLDLPPLLARRLAAASGLRAVEEAGLKVTGGRLLGPETPDGTAWLVALEKPSGSEHILTLDYVVVLRSDPEAGRRPPTVDSRCVEVPLAWPLQAGQVETRVRLWCAEGLQPSVAGPGWDVSPWTELADEPDNVPILVLRTRQKRPLALWLRESAGASVVVERALFRVVVSEGGLQTYRADYRLSKLLPGVLAVDWPATPAGLDLHVRLDGRPVRVTDKGLDLEPYVFVGDEPLQVRQPHFLAITYKLPGERPSAPWDMQTRLVPPVLKGDVLYHEVRWQVELPAGWVVVDHGGGQFAEQKWGWRGRLLGPRPAVSAADLERWFGGFLEGGEPPHSTPKISAEPSLVCWQVQPQTLRVTHLPTQGWLLTCSLAFVVIGLALFWVPLPRGVFWAALAALGLAVALGAVLDPQVVAAIAFGCEPGLVVVLFVLGLQWLLHRRYRRQVVFMPGFTRLKQGSSLIRSGNRPRGEPSTVDAPTAPKEGAPSSQLRS